MPYRSSCNKNNVSVQLKARVKANMRPVIIIIYHDEQKKFFDEVENLFEKS